MTDPKIYLAVDNCFASKRWTAPKEWMDVISALGLYWVEASADTECDPLYMGADYMKRWAYDVTESSAKTGVCVANLYSGHGTYATLGLAHTDPEVRSRFLNDWLKPMAKTASEIGAGLGFFCHAFSDSVLQDNEKYAEFKENLYNDLSELAAYSKSVGCTPIGVEQMYSPHQIPWTVGGAFDLIREVTKRADAPFYITIDVGHQSGQRKFVRPDRAVVKDYLSRKNKGEDVPEAWFGPRAAFDLFEKADDCNDSTVDSIIEAMKGHDHFFAEYDDGDTYRWLSELGGASPIIHLQQTDGVSSAHLPFTDECNAKGIIRGEKVLAAIKRAYDSEPSVGMPPKPDKIYLTLEMFTGTAAINRAQLQKMEKTVEYWRKFIPADGMNLSELVK